MGRKKLSILMIVGIMMIAFTVWNGMQTEAASGAWRHNTSGWWYQYSNGSYPRDSWVEINGGWYHFNSKGYMQTGWLKLGSNWYFLGTDGKMVTGQKNIGGNLYYFQNNGIWIKTRYPSGEGWWYQSPKGKWFEYFGGSSPRGYDIIIDGKGYYFDLNGYVRTGWYKGVVDKDWRYSGSDGVMYTGWNKINGKWYYFYDEQYSNDASFGVMVTGLCNLDGYYYFFGTNGAMQTGWKNIEGAWYYFCSNGKAATGQKTIGGKTYYFTSEGVCFNDVIIKDGIIQPGWKKVNNKWYYFTSNGDLTVGWKRIDGEWYYFSLNGEMTVGWEKIKGKWNFFDEDGKYDSILSKYTEYAGLKDLDSIIGGWIPYDKSMTEAFFEADWLPVEKGPEGNCVDATGSLTIGDDGEIYGSVKADDGGCEYSFIGQFSPLRMVGGNVSSDGDSDIFYSAELTRFRWDWTLEPIPDEYQLFKEKKTYYFRVISIKGGGPDEPGGTTLIFILDENKIPTGFTFGSGQW